ncbi:MAG: phosphatidate cytidylyltransferase [Mycobacteriales bacterium]
MTRASTRSGPVSEIPAVPTVAGRGRPSPGRDLSAAVAVGVSFFIVVAVSVTLYRPVFVGLLVLLSALGVGELVRAVRRRGARPPVPPLLASTVAMPVVAWFEGSSGLGVALLATIFVVIVWRLFGPTDGFVRDVSAAVFIAAYVPLLAAFAVLLAHPHNGARLVVTFGTTVVASDIGGYATGVFLGRHKMAPKISPGKSWEGFVGSLVLCTAVGVLTVGLWLDEAWWKGVVFGLAAAITATVGDLCESAIKRDLGIKDMGNVLPGHGGVMDRLDSLLPGAAVSYLLLAALT